jgi:hypothetical protein
LRLGTRSYSLFERFALGEIQLYEYGTFRSDGELLHFEPQLSSGERPPLVELTRVRAGSATWLLEPHLVPALFYPPDREDSPFRGQLDAAFVSGGTHLEPPDRPAVPAYYTAERERCARLRLVEFIPEERPGGPPRARFERISGGRPELSEWLWFDGELCTSVRASVSEIESTGVLAVFDLPPGYEIGRLQPGAVFACLPRLE